MSRGSLCTWKCPHDCGKRCGGVSGHEGPHQCPKHYQKVTVFGYSRYGCIICIQKYPNFPMNWNHKN